MKALAKILKYIFLIVLVISFTFLVARLANPQVSKPTITEATIKEELLPLAELSTYQYNYTTIVKYESQKDFYGIKVPFTTSQFLISYEGTIKAGFSFEQLKVIVEQQHVEVVIPIIRLTSHEIHYDTLEVYDEKNSIFNPITITNYNDFYTDHSREMEIKAIKAGLFENARANAIQVVENYLKMILPEDYTLTVK